MIKIWNSTIHKIYNLKITALWYYYVIVRCLKYKLTSVYILHAVWVQTSVSICVIHYGGVVYYIVPGPPGHDTHHTLHMDKISSDHTDRDRCLYPYCIQNRNGCQTVLEEADYHIVLISQHSNFMPVSFMYSRILYFNHSSVGDAIPRLACWTCIPLFQKTSWWWHPSADKCRNLILVINCT